MKKNLLVLLLPLALLGQTIKVSDLVGDWYGSTFFQVCYQGVLCTASSVETKPYATKMSISIKDSTLEVVSNAKSQAQDFYDVNTVINYFFEDTLRLPIENGAVYWPTSAIHSNVLYLSRLDGPGMSLTRNAKNYFHKLLPPQHFPGGGQLCLDDSSAIIFLEPGGNHLSWSGDTLIISPCITKFLYDYDSQVFRNVGNKGMTLKIINSHTVLIAFKNRNEGGYRQLELINNDWSPLRNDWSGYAGTWQSKTRSDAFIKISSSSTITSYVVTNSIDGLQQIKYSPHPSQGMATLEDTDTLKVTALNDGRALYFNGTNASILSTDGPPKFLLEQQLYKFYYTGSALINRATGEEFSKVTGLDDNHNDTEIALRANPVADEVEVLQVDRFDYQLYNSMGILVKEGHADASKIQINEHPQGVYILKVFAKEQNLAFRLVKD